MFVLTDSATYELLSSELTNCPRADAVGELAVQWQQMVVSLRRVEQKAVSSQNLANSIEGLNRTRAEAVGDRLRLKDGERLYPKRWPGNPPLGGFAREVTA